MSRYELPITLKKQLKPGDSLSGCGSIEGKVTRLELHATSGAVRITVEPRNGGSERFAVYYPSGMLVEVLA